MPIFEYKCNKCGHKMDFLEKSGSKSKHVCEKCKAIFAQLERADFLRKDVV